MKLWYNRAMKLSHLLAALPSFEVPPLADDPDITLITTDSRKVIPGALFVAYPGVSVDGHRFVPQAIERGAVAIVANMTQPNSRPSRTTHHASRLISKYAMVEKPSPGSMPRGMAILRAS